jgi:hypothetical protein
MKRNEELTLSTAQITATAFRQHGRVDMLMKDDVLYYEATGPFNEELFDALALAQKSFLQKADIAGPWASICVLVDSALTSPGGVARYLEIMRTPKPPQFTPVATAFVIGPEIDGGAVMAPHFVRVFEAIGRPMRVFSKLEEAQRWTAAMLQADRTNATGAKD